MSTKASRAAAADLIAPICRVPKYSAQKVDDPVASIPCPTPKRIIPMPATKTVSARAKTMKDRAKGTI